MTHYRAAAVVAAMITAVIFAVGCGSRTTPAPAASLGARASALATSPAVLHAERHMALEVQSCASQHGITLIVKGAGTTHMSVKVYHVAGLVMLHPVHTISNILACAGLTKQKLAATVAYAKQAVLTNGFGSGSGAKDFTQIINYASQQQAS